MCVGRSCFEHDSAFVPLLRDQLARCGPLRRLRAGFVLALALVTCGCLAYCLSAGAATPASPAGPRRSQKCTAEAAGASFAATSASLRRALLPCLAERPDLAGVMEIG